MSARGKKRRADVLLAERGLAESREQARILIMEGLVFAPSGRVAKASSALAEDTALEVRGRLAYVSRGGLKMAHALKVFGREVEGQTALDVGASTGGFTDCLLQGGVRHVYAVDAGHGQLHLRLRQDPRVTVMEKVNARHRFELPEAVDLAVIDVSFISLTLVIPQAVAHLGDGGYIVALVKPQFEARKGEVGRGGIVKDPKVHAATLGKMVLWAANEGLRIRDMCGSPIRGDKGNREFFLLLQKPSSSAQENGKDTGQVPAFAGTTGKELQKPSSSAQENGKETGQVPAFAGTTGKEPQKPSSSAQENGKEPGKKTGE